MYFCSLLSLWVCAHISLGGGSGGGGGREYANGVVCMWKGPWHRTTLQTEGWATTLVMPPLAIQFCPNHSRLIHQAETFHISSSRSFWQLTSCSMLFFAMMAWASHSAFSAPLPTAVLPAVQCSKSVPRPKLHHSVHFPLTLHSSDFKSHHYVVPWGNLDGGGDWDNCMKNTVTCTSKCSF